MLHLVYMVVSKAFSSPHTDCDTSQFILPLWLYFFPQLKHLITYFRSLKFYIGFVFISGLLSLERIKIVNRQSDENCLDAKQF